MCAVFAKKVLFKLKEMIKNVKQKAGFRWICVLKPMFILLFTRINYQQSSIVSKISIYLATHVTSDNFWSAFCVFHAHFWKKRTVSKNVR